MKEGQSLMFLGAATIDSPFDRLHLSFMRTVYSTALIFMNKGRNYAYADYWDNALTIENFNDVLSQCPSELFEDN